LNLLLQLKVIHSVDVVVVVECDRIHVTIVNGLLLSAGLYGSKLTTESVGRCEKIAVPVAGGQASYFI
jgi:hypothetical protein